MKVLLIVSQKMTDGKKYYYWVLLSTKVLNTYTYLGGRPDLRFTKVTDIQKKCCHLNNN